MELKNFINLLVKNCYCLVFLCDFDQEKLKDLLAKFDTISEKSIKNDMNFFDVEGYPHYENVASSILEFYLDPKNEHLLYN